MEYVLAGIEADYWYAASELARKLASNNQPSKILIFKSKHGSQMYAIAQIYFQEHIKNNPIFLELFSHFCDYSHSE